jgi:glucose/arabinose dehydrogenase
MKKLHFITGLLTWVFVAGFFSVASCRNGNLSSPQDTAVIATGLDTPWEILWGPDNMLWITERGGTVSRINPDSRERVVLLSIDVTQQGEAGLLGMALHPDFASNPFVYLVYNYSDAGNIRERLVRFTLLNNQLVNEEILINDIPGNTFHNGSRLVFDASGKLLMTTGDAGNMQLAQDPSSLNGKLLRINPDGSVPDDNPTPGSYVWALGLRNSQGLAISPSGIIYATEHGPETDDEVNILQEGRNYGWPDVRGMCDTDTENLFCDEFNVMEPMVAYTPTLALAGLAWYGDGLIDEWRNSLLVTSLKAGQLLALHLNDQGTAITGTTVIYNNELGRLRDVCVSPQGRVFISTSNRDGRGDPDADDDKIIELYPSSATSIGDDFGSPDIRLYPNPTSGIIKAVLPDAFTNGSFEVFDLNGAVVLSGSGSFLVEGVDVSGLKQGVYFIRILNGNSVLSFPLTVMR